ncbi:MAG: hypothetical protein AAGC56_12160 [Pseudomonadota bacterium]
MVRFEENGAVVTPARAATGRRGRRFGLRQAAALVAGAGLLNGAVCAETLAQPKSDALERKAANYVQYRQDVAAIEADKIDGPAATREAHKRLAAHDPANLSGGWVAYAALVAASTPDFVESIKKETSRRKRHKGLRGRDAFFARLSEDPSFPRKLPGAKAATERVLSMTLNDGARFVSLGETFKTQAYAMQKTKWGKKRIAASSVRLTEASAFADARTPYEPIAAGTEDGGVKTPTLGGDGWTPEWGDGARRGKISESNAQVVMDRVLNLAARYAIGGLNEKVVDVYAKNNKSEQCLSMARLTLRQCIAATRTPYEEAFCLGEHGLNDVSDCMGWVAGVGSS